MPFEGFDLTDFWEPSDYATTKYIDEPLTDALLARVEAQLGYKLPAAYVALARTQNGGEPRRTCHRTPTRTTWSADHIAITAIFGIGVTKDYSLAAPFGSHFWLEEWGYPDIGVYFANCPLAGHDMLCLDYSACGPTGEPRVVHIDQEVDYQVTLLAPNFESFIRGLVHEGTFPETAGV